MMKPLMNEIIKAAKIIKSGGIVAFPTETSYGLGSSIFFADTLERIFMIKKRDEDKPLLLLVPDTSHLDILVTHIPDDADEIMKNFWPGPVTLIFPAKVGIPWQITARTNKVGIRISSNPWALALVKEVGHPITATSANTAGTESCNCAEEVRENLINPAPDYILDGGKTTGGSPSTIIDVSVNPLHLVRKGAIDKKNIEEKLNIKISE